MAVRKRCLGIDIGFSAIKIAELSLEKDNTIRITKLVNEEVDIPLSASEEERRAGMIAALRRALKQNKITTKEGAFAIPGQVVIIRRTRLPKTSPERLAHIIPYLAREQIPFPVELSRLEYQVFEDETEAGESEVLMVAIRKDHLAHHLGVITRIPLKPIVIGVSSLALFNYYSYIFDTSRQVIKEEKEGIEVVKKKGGFFQLPKISLKPGGLLRKKVVKEMPETKEEEGGVVTEEVPYTEVKGYINFGATSFDLCIGRHGKVSRFGFARSVARGGVDVTEAIRERLGLSDYQEAERVKREKTAIIAGETKEVLEARGINKEAGEAAIAIIDRIVADIRRSLDFYISQPDGIMVDSIVVSGGGAQLPEVATYLEEKLGTPVDSLTKIASPRVILEPELKERRITPFPIALGLALQGLGVSPIKIDFLPPELKVVREFKTKKPLVLAMFSLLALMVGITSIAGNRYLGEFMRQKDDFDNFSERNKALLQKAQDAENKRREIKEHFDRLTKMAVKRDYWLEFLIDIQSQRPEDIWIEWLWLKPNGEVQIVGRAEVEESVPHFTENLKAALKEKIEGDLNLYDIARVYDDNLKKEVTRFALRLICKDKKSRWQKEIITERAPTPVGTPVPGLRIPPAAVMPSEER